MLRTLTALILTFSQSVAFAADLRLRKCAVDICGSAELLENYGGNLKEPESESVEGFYSKNIEPIVAEIMEENRRHFLEIQEDARNIAESPISREVTINADRGIVFQFLIAVLRKYPEILIEDGNGRIQLNGKALEKALSKAGPAFGTWFTSLLTTFIASKSIKARSDLSDIEDLDQFLDSFKFEGEPEDRMATAVKFIEQGLRHGNYLGFKNLYTAFILQKLKDHQPLSTTDGKQVVRALKDGFVTQAFFQDEALFDVVAQTKIDTASMFKVLGMQERLEAIAAGLRDQKKWQQRVKREQVYCRNKIIPALRATLIDSDFEQAMGAYSVWKEIADETLQDFLPPAEALVLKTKFHQLRYVLPESREQLQSRMNTDFSQELLQAQMDTKMDQEYRKMNHPEITLANAFLFSGDRSVGVRSLCDNFELEAIKDNMASGYEKTYVTLGWRSFKFWDAGAGVIGHELGHVVYKHAQKASLKSVNSCRAQQFTAITGQPLKIHQQYENEEFADLFGATLQDKLMKMGFRNMRNAACVLIAEPTIEKTYSSLNLSNGNKKDEHPASFYRVLRWQVELGRPLPESCSGLAGGDVLRAFAKSCRPKN